MNAAANRIDPDHRLTLVRYGIGRRQDDDRGRIGWRVTIEQAERSRNHAGREIIVHRKRIAEQRLGIVSGAPAGRERDLPELPPRRAVQLEMPRRIYREPVDRKSVGWGKGG